MAKINTLAEDFLNGINAVEIVLSSMLFKRAYFSEKGFAYFVGYKKDETNVEFLFGPSNWDVEMIVYTSKRKYAFKDLLQIPEILKWVSENKYRQNDGRNVENELMWFAELLKVSLPFIITED